MAVGLCATDDTPVMRYRRLDGGEHQGSDHEERACERNNGATKPVAAFRMRLTIGALPSLIFARATPWSVTEKLALLGWPEFSKLLFLLYFHGRGRRTTTIHPADGSVPHILGICSSQSWHNAIELLMRSL